jgi:hypothetical protein
MNMTMIIRSSLIVLLLIGCTSGIGLPRPTGPFDEFRDVNCESEMARLDNFAVALQNEPTARGAIIFFAGKMKDDRLPKRGEAEARVERLRSYLTKRRGIPTASIVVMNGGYDNNYRVQLWVVPGAEGLPKREASSGVMDMQYRPGKINPRDYRCGI